MKKLFITFIRLAVGWHFLYEGLTKLVSGNWSAEGYLNNTFGTFSGFYQWLASSPTMLQFVDFFNIWGLILIGLALSVGLVIRWASLSGALLLALYYFAYPPFGTSMPMGDANNYIVDKNFIEAIVLMFFVFSSEKGYGLQNIVKISDIRKFFTSKKKDKEPKTGEVKGRREVLKNLVSLPVLGALGWGANKTFKWYGMDGLSGATIQINRLNLNELNGELPMGKIKNIEISRLIMGGNLIGGWAHARDLIYAESLFKAYNTEKKIFDTLVLCEQAGINAMNIGFPTMTLLQKYKKITGSKLNVTVQVALDKKNDDIYDNVTRAIDSGMDMIQLQGNQCDWLVRDGDFEKIAMFMERIRSQGYPAGMGAHTIDSLILCEEQGIIPDFYMKTMHHDNYWSAHPRENRQPFEVDGKKNLDHNMFHDNCFCPFPDRTIEFVSRTKVPVIGFKVLAAGAIHPKDGFKWAFENGADFICVGMFDFQVVSDVNICIDTLAALSNRTRAWFA
jgi:uncharacterized membrane protein YphA (DoxX/SURF4 family)